MGRLVRGTQLSRGLRWRNKEFASGFYHFRFIFLDGYMPDNFEGDHLTKSHIGHLVTRGAEWITIEMNLGMVKEKVWPTGQVRITAFGFDRKFIFKNITAAKRMIKNYYEQLSKIGDARKVGDLITSIVRDIEVKWKFDKKHAGVSKGKPRVSKKRLSELKKRATWSRLKEKARRG